MMKAVFHGLALVTEPTPAAPASHPESLAASSIGHRVSGENARAHATAAGPRACAGAREARVRRSVLEAGTRGGARVTDSRPRTAAGGPGKPRSGSQDGVKRENAGTRASTRDALRVHQHESQKDGVEQADRAASDRVQGADLRQAQRVDGAAPPRARGEQQKPEPHDLQRAHRQLDEEVHGAVLRHVLSLGHVLVVHRAGGRVQPRHERHRQRYGEVLDAIASGSNPMSLANGSTKIVLDKNILPFLHNIAEHKFVKLSAQEEIKLGDALEKSMGDIVDKLAGIDKVKVEADAEDNVHNHDDDLTDSAPSENDGNEKNNEEEPSGPAPSDKHEQQAGNTNLEDKESVVEDVVEIDEYEDINPTTSKYVRLLVKKNIRRYSLRG
ncbi:hypothetical protein PC121_g2723 [Phytophthora cactorum]|nr:hypothetical protein PC120_g495 [Phytophthora cactorum]KAG3095701.1 hypothetical protein PC121_g2723 [Phytophthora cactorum]